MHKKARESPVAGLSIIAWIIYDIFNLCFNYVRFKTNIAEGIESIFMGDLISGQQVLPNLLLRDNLHDFYFLVESIIFLIMVGLSPDGYKIKISFEIY